jgi:hypothetical protein
MFDHIKGFWISIILPTIRDIKSFENVKKLNVITNLRLQE